MKKIKNFFKSKKVKLFGALSAVMTTLMGIACFAEETGAVGGLTPIPSSGTMDLSVLNTLWKYTAGMLVDTINIIASQQLLVMLVICLPLVGIGIGLFSRLKNA